MPRGMAKKKKPTQNQIASLDWETGQMKQLSAEVRMSGFKKSKKKKISSWSTEKKRLENKRKRYNKHMDKENLSWCLIGVSEEN